MFNYCREERALRKAEMEATKVSSPSPSRLLICWSCQRYNALTLLSIVITWVLVFCFWFLISIFWPSHCIEGHYYLYRIILWFWKMLTWESSKVSSCTLTVIIAGRKYDCAQGWNLFKSQKDLVCNRERENASSKGDFYTVVVVYVMSCTFKDISVPVVRWNLNLFFWPLKSASTIAI